MLTTGDISIAFRVDSGAVIGSGHLVRCLNLARELRRLGERPAFFCRPHAGMLASLIEGEFPLVRLDPSPALRADSGASDWLGATQEADAQELAARLPTARPLAAIVGDHYGIGRAWTERLRPLARRMLLIDDLADRPLSGDFVLNENLWPEDPVYRPLLPADTRCLLGPAYVLLGAGFERAHALAGGRRAGQLRRLLVFFGSMDVSDECGKFLRALAQRPALGEGLQITVLLGPGNRRAPRLLREYADLPVRLLTGTDNMLALLQTQDYVLGALGFSIWERFCLGLNSSIVAVADNQIAVSERLAEADLIDYLGEHQHLGEGDYQRFLRRLNQLDPSTLEARRQAMRRLVDGRGCARVADRLLELAG